ncbi:ABC-2 transporter permease [Paenibacillus sp. HW567]|uniref:ABC-2 transporter permease n=1 Tax=Paenibacillus sp. HW567 TaxID=1034769 RepID=UPI00037845EE|nr:ABC-2 transporter permease [Paenibacillus sp. HW567]
MYSSLHLIRKDFMLLHKFMLLLIPYFLIMAYTNIDYYTMFGLFPSMLMMMNACTLDVQHNNQRFLVNLPLRRQQLVLAKYLALLPYCLISLISTLLIYGTAFLLGWTSEPVAWRELFLVIATFPMLAAIYLPLYYWLGQKGMQIVNFVFIMLIMINVTGFSSLKDRFPAFSEWLATGTTDSILIPVIAGLAYVIILYCSYLISLRIYIKKDV